MAYSRMWGRRLAATLVSLAICAGGFAQSAAAAGQCYVVQPHDTLSGIAQAYGTTVAALMAANNLTNANLIQVGQTLTIPSGGGTAQAATGAVQASYVVQSGDTLSAIGQRFGVSVADLAQVNGIADPSAISVGQQIAIPAGSDNPGAGTLTPAVYTSSGATYMVVAGDTLSSIALRYGTTAEALAQTNNISLAATLSVGTQLAIPATGGGGGGASVQSILVQEANAAGLQPALLEAVAWQESGWTMVTAADGGMGVMQLMPDSVTWISNSLLGYQIDPYNITDNIRGGAAMLRYFLGVFGDEREAIAAYHQGMTSIETIGMTPDTQAYVANVLALQQRFGG